MRSPTSRQSTKRPSKLSSLWTQNLQEEALKESFKAKLFNMSNDPAILRLIEIVEKRKEELSRIEQSHETYTNPSWSHLQAHINGEISTCNYILDLLSFAKGPN